VSWYVPAWQTQPAGVVPPVSITAFEGHVQQVGTVLATMSELNCPTGHVYEMHAETPASLLYVPAGHAVHSPVVFSKYPGIHPVHASMEMLPGNETMFGGQSVQVSWPIMSLNLPTGHC